MGFRNITIVVSADLVAGGTVTLNYPSNTDEDSYATYGHTAEAIGVSMVSPADFDLTFGSANITFTYGAGKTTIPSGSQLAVGVNLPEATDREAPVLGPVVPTHGPKASMNGLLYVDLGSPVASDADGIFESAAITAAADITGTLLLDAAALVSGNVATLDVPRNIVAAWTTTAVMTVSGLDALGNAMSEASASGTSFTGTKAFAVVDTISVSVDVTGATVGTGELLGLPVYLPDLTNVVAEFEDAERLEVQSNDRTYVHYDLDAVKFIAGTSHFVSSPVEGELRSHTFTVVNAVSAHDVIMGIEIGGADVVGLQGTTGDLTSAAVGTVTTDTIAAGVATAAIAKNGAIEIDMDISAQTTGQLHGVIEVRPVTRFTPGVDTLATTTTGDVRGTYLPPNVADGALHFGVLLQLGDPTYTGVAQA